MEFSPGINALVGVNGMGKTHLMKACYAAYDVAKSGGSFAAKLNGVCLPANGSLHRLIKQGATSAAVAVRIGELVLDVQFTGEVSLGQDAVSLDATSVKLPLASVYILPKEMLSNAPGFLGFPDYPVRRLM